MSELAQTLIYAAMRTAGILASGETPNANEQSDGLLSLRMMLREWSARNMRLYAQTQVTLSLDGSSTYYTIGPGGDIDTTRPKTIKGGYIRDAYNADTKIVIIDEARYREFVVKSLGGTPQYLWYNPNFPLGELYLWPIGSGTAYIDCLMPFTEPSILEDSVDLPPEYEEAIKWNLALRFSAEYGREPSALVAALASNSLRNIESKNFDAQVNAANLRDELADVTDYDINSG